MLNRRHVLTASLTAIGLGLALFAAMGSLLWPLADDQEIFVWDGEVISGGGVPYRDVWDTKGPLVFYAFASATWLFGDNEMAIRVLDLAAMFGCCWLLRKFVLRVNGNDAFGATLAVTFYALAYYGWWISTPAQPDGWAAALILVAVMLLTERTQSVFRAMTAAGAAIAIATLLKPLYLIFMALPLLLPPSNSVPLRLIFPRLACVAVFCAIVLVSMLALSMAGGLADYMDILRFLFSTHVPRAHKQNALELTCLQLWSLRLFIPLLLAPIGLWAMREINTSHEVSLMVAWLLLSLSSIIVQGWNFDYHWLPVSLALAPILGCFFSWLKSKSETPQNLSVKTGVLILVWLAVIAPLFTEALLHSYMWPGYLLGKRTREQFMRQLTAPWNYWDLERVSEYVEQRSEPGDFILVWGWDPLINIRAARRPPTRFAFSYPVVAQSPLQSKYRRIFLCDLLLHPPKYIVVDARGQWAMLDHSGTEYMREFPRFQRFVYDRYEMVLSINNFDIFLLTAREARKARDSDVDDRCRERRRTAATYTTTGRDF